MIALAVALLIICLAILIGSVCAVMVLRELSLSGKLSWKLQIGHKPRPPVTHEQITQLERAVLEPPKPPKPPKPWTPLEREVLGINDTDRFIRETDAVLRRVALAADECVCPLCGRTVKYNDAHLETFHPEMLPSR